MHVEEVRKLLRTRPFQPFTIHLPEGRSVEVTNADFALLSPNGRTLIAYDRDESFNLIDVMLITSIESGPPLASAQPSQPTPSNP